MVKTVNEFYWLPVHLVDGQIGLASNLEIAEFDKSEYWTRYEELCSGALPYGLEATLVGKWVFLRSFSWCHDITKQFAILEWVSKTVMLGSHSHYFALWMSVLNVSIGLRTGLHIEWWRLLLPLTFLIFKDSQRFLSCPWFFDLKGINFVKLSFLEDANWSQYLNVISICPSKPIELFNKLKPIFKIFISICPCKPIVLFNKLAFARDFKCENITFLWITYITWDKYTWFICSVWQHYFSLAHGDNTAHHLRHTQLIYLYYFGQIIPHWETFCICPLHGSQMLY